VSARLKQCLLALVSLSLLAPSAASAAGPPSSEPFFPRSGNPGYDVSHYDVSLAYRPGNGRLRGTVTIAAKAKQRLGRFSLDLVGLRVTGATVDGEPTAVRRGRDKLKLAPEAPPAAHAEFTTVIHYQGHPRRVVDADGSSEGWIRTTDGAFGVGEPLGTAAWIPCNNVLRDKASFDFHVTVPERLKAVANGRLVGVSEEGRRRSFDWSAAEPMAPYLAVVDIGRGKLERSKAAGVDAWTLVDPQLEPASGEVLAALPRVIGFESRLFGPYPFDAAGSIVDNAPKLGYALETQTRPIYAFAPDLTTLVHETAHQWFGDSAGLARWPNIWLNEGFATWIEWYYAERHGGRSAERIFRALYRVPASKTEFWNPPSGHPGQPKNLFATSTYVRGGMALEALRLGIGTRPMLNILRRWATENRYGSGDIGDFVALAEQVSGHRLARFFERWLYRPGKPRARPTPPAASAAGATRPVAPSG
jgi:aminopeptidase N